MVRRQDASWRDCVDYCRLNAITIRDVDPIPRMGNVLDRRLIPDWEDAFWTVQCLGKFLKLMEQELVDLKWTVCSTYMVDILVLSAAFREHLNRLKAILGVLSSSGLCLGPAKCVIAPDGQTPAKIHRSEQLLQALHSEPCRCYASVAPPEESGGVETQTKYFCNSGRR
ncbi:hypothetical protein M514_09543 [Trichuris suis]|uniref:Reverse transcriptase domain-containing protein n=1 Tax=Trichuris suis TaxID=68888 RepID=A0A085NL17_9BILA|nr:hypothetical protein M514_09543 [Trichuris suis]